jgi:pimeloyl-ACP methyl ester carboxylesterase
LSTIKYKNIKINYNSFGKGNAVVLIHGFLENVSMWNNVVPLLSKKNRIITIDLLGHGKTANLSYVHTMSDQAKMIKAVLNHLKLRRIILIGHSMGGYVSLAFAELFPKNVKAICLMNSISLADTAIKKENREKAIALVKKNPSSFVKLAIPNLFSEESKEKYKPEIEKIKQEALQTSQQGIIAALEGMKIRKNRTSVFQNTDYKKLLIASKNDPVLNYKNVIKIVQQTNIELVTFSNGHMSHIENRNELNENLLKFVNHI